MGLRVREREGEPGERERREVRKREERVGGREEEVEIEGKRGGEGEKENPFLP